MTAWGPHCNKQYSQLFILPLLSYLLLLDQYQQSVCELKRPPMSRMINQSTFTLGETTSRPYAADHFVNCLFPVSWRATVTALFEFFLCYYYCGFGLFSVCM